MAVTVWSDRVDAVVSEPASAWMSDALGRSCKLVFMPDDAEREASFADGYPYLLTSEASLAELDRRVGHPIDMERFRPNITNDGANRRSRVATVRPNTPTLADIDFYVREARRQRSAAAHRLVARIGRGLRRFAG